jgi:hypothetical protein
MPKDKIIIPCPRRGTDKVISGFLKEPGKFAEWILIPI